MRRLICIMTSDSRPSTRERLLDATVALMRAKGAAASGTLEILERAQAPRGSFYFHFPEGKDQLVLEALDRAAAQTLAMIEDSLACEGGPADQVGAIFRAVEEDLVAHDYEAGCAVAMTTLERASASERFQQAVAAAFETWTRALTRGLVRGGVTPERASELSEVIVAMTEGATLLARARRDPAPVRAAARTMQLAVRDGASPTVGPA
jgi:TetR/AcrR family transcriptional regulator, lmrAB and yxaGH operons repressor